VRDGDPALRPDKHIFVELKAPWYTITDHAAQMTKPMLVAWRRRRHPQR
jgi:hypothetical protein